MSQFTKENGQVFLPLDEHVEHFIGDVFDFFMFNLMTEPLENRFLFSQVTCMQMRRWSIEKLATANVNSTTQIRPSFAYICIKRKENCATGNLLPS
jgi:hypothetical protein